MHTHSRLLLALGISTLAPAAFAQFYESPGTVAPGEWLMETDVVSIAYDRHTPARDGVHYRSTYVGYVQVTTGVTPTFDVQFGLDAWREERATGAGVDERARGMGELYLRAKWQFLPGEQFSAAVLPFVRLPQTADRDLRPDRTQWGVIVPWLLTWTETWSLGGQFQLDSLDDFAGGRDEWFTATLLLSRSVNDKLGVYAEAMTSAAPSVARNWATLVGGGVTWQATEKFSWDVGFLIGLTRVAPDFNPVVRFVWAF